MKLRLYGKDVTTIAHIYDALVIGTGAAGYGCALHLHRKGIRNIAIITNGINRGTSRNTGSDKQTYYRMASAGDQCDSPEKMAQALFQGGCMDGDIALCEAGGSSHAFYNLVSLDVGFPCNEYGEYPGYKTDHDPLQRGSSAGPYTSRFMTEQLEKEAVRLGIKRIDKNRVVKLLVDNGKAAGCITLSDSDNCIAYGASAVVAATGGMPVLFSRCVYPKSQHGAHGVFAREGVVFQNCGEWQYGIGSVKVRWNCSGSYQQVLPRYVSVDSAGNEYEFLEEYFSDSSARTRAIFQKGYQWPFDSRKTVQDGSSRIDIAVYNEVHNKNRRVFLDFINNPQCSVVNGTFSADALDRQVYEYLEKSDAFGETPVERLQKMNEPAYRLYRDLGIDLENEYLEIDVMAQHINGGVKVDTNWQSSLDGLYVVGEAAGTHGVYRPGGSALNSGQVGAMRAADAIAVRIAKENTTYTSQDLFRIVKENLATLVADEKSTAGVTPKLSEKESRRCHELCKSVQVMNTKVLSFFRYKDRIKKALSSLASYYKEFATIDPRECDLREYFTAYEVLTFSEIVYRSVDYYLCDGGESRGSYLIPSQNTVATDTTAMILGDPCSHDHEKERSSYHRIIEAWRTGGTGATPGVEVKCRSRRPVPTRRLWFEKTWREFRKHRSC